MPTECSKCEGRGEIEVHHDGNPEHAASVDDCDACGGTGEDCTEPDMMDEAKSWIEDNLQTETEK